MEEEGEPQDGEPEEDGTGEAEEAFEGAAAFGHVDDEQDAPGNGCAPDASPCCPHNVVGEDCWTCERERAFRIDVEGVEEAPFVPMAWAL